MATAKITITLEQDDEAGTDEGMAQTIALLASLGITPATKLVLTLECEEEDAETHRDDLRVTLRGRPVGINVKIKTAIEEEVARERLIPVTPMDRQGWN
jgi:hypothetical protein